MIVPLVEASDRWSFKGVRAVLIENRLVRVTVLPELGGKIYEMIYKPSSKEVLWHNPRIPPKRVGFGAAFDDVWSGGWDEIFPNDAVSTVDGEKYPDMGEVWSIEWDYMIKREDDDASSVTLQNSTFSAISPCKITRVLTLKEDSPQIDLGYTLENVGNTRLKFIWKLTQRST